MQKEPIQKDYVLQAVLSAAIRTDYDHFRPLSPTVKGIEDELIEIL